MSALVHKNRKVAETVDTPVQGILTQAEFDALPSAQQNKGLYVIDDGPSNGGGGSSGPDGNPIGTVISYMGMTAPKDYLICDGALYNITDYYALAQFFKTQFGAENYFGGDGTTTFAVPDMRNLFLRGYHGEAAELLSSDIGKKQEATKHPNLWAATSSGGFAGMDGALVENVDSRSPAVSYKYFISSSSAASTGDYINYTSRPVNMAVLYCIKARTAEAYENNYSAEETRIGTWIDGRPLYRKVVTGTSASTKAWAFVEGTDGISIKTAHGFISRSDDAISYIPDAYCIVSYLNFKAKLGVYVIENTYSNSPFELIIEYTKTTDPVPTNALPDTPVVLNSQLDPPTSVSIDGTEYDVTLPPVVAYASASASSAKLNL